MSVLKYTEANFTTLDIAKHDRCASVISHVPHVAAAALVTLLNRSQGDMESCLKLAGGGFKDTTRIASSNADMWADICMTNSGNIAASLDELAGVLTEAARLVRAGDRNGIHAYFIKAKSVRNTLLSQEKGVRE